MNRYRSRIGMLLLSVVLLSACASTGKAVAQLEPGMTKQQVLQILGEPADRSFRGTDEAWQYQEIAGFGQCKYTTVWISGGKLVGISTRRGSSVAGCGLGSQEVRLESDAFIRLIVRWKGCVQLAALGCILLTRP